MNKKIMGISAVIGIVVIVILASIFKKDMPIPTPQVDPIVEQVVEGVDTVSVTPIQ